MENFPGTELEVYEKYPDSRRLDHPHFTDVSKTSYAKGVIMEFKKINDDPIQVKSLVRVKCEKQGETDFLPIFFQPKDQYWDGDATDFESGPGFFKKAWMSFRGDDEVVVIVKEDNPIAVLAFADGVPRVGEDVVCMKGGGKTGHVRMSLAADHPSAEGPDGNDLCLELKSEVIGTIPEDHEHLVFSEIIYDSVSTRMELTVVPYVVNFPLFKYNGTMTTVNFFQSSDWNSQKAYRTSMAEIHLVKVGPILYLFVVTGAVNFRVKNETGGNPDAWVELISRPIFGTIASGSTCFAGLIANFPGFTWEPHDFCSGPDDTLLVRAQDAVDFNNADYPQYPHEPFDEEAARSAWDSARVSAVYAAPYSDKLYQDTVDSPPEGYNWTLRELDPVPDGFTKQAAFDPYADPPVINFYITEGLTGKLGEVKFYVRPHTKSELQDAGMWPE